MKNILEIFKVYGIKEAYLKETKKVEIVITKRIISLSLARWLNFVSALKTSFSKEIEFLLKDEALKIYDNLDGFTLIGE